MDPLSHLSSSPSQEDPSPQKSPSKPTTDNELVQSDTPNAITSLNINIFNFEEKKIDGGKNSVVFYKVQVNFTKKNKKWFLSKRYSEFDALNKQLVEIYPNMPVLPSKTFFKLSSEQEIQDRMKNLNEYLKVSFIDFYTNVRFSN